MDFVYVIRRALSQQITLLILNLFDPIPVQSVCDSRCSEAEGVTITPSRSQLLNQWARNGLPASLPI